MPQYQVDSERIQSSSAAVATSISQIRQAVGGMYTNLNALQDAWRGSAATQFTAVAEQWRAAQQQMEASLESIQRSLTQASTAPVCQLVSWLPSKRGARIQKRDSRRSPLSAQSASDRLRISSPCRHRRPGQQTSAPACWQRRPRWSGTDQRWRRRSAERSGSP